MKGQFDSTNQPTNRRGPNKLKKAIPLFEELGINPLTEAIKEIKKKRKKGEAIDPARKAELWLKVASFVYPTAKEDNIPSTPSDSKMNVDKMFEEAKKKAMGDSNVRSPEAQ